MRLRGEQQLQVSPERFWELLFNPDHLTQSIPGAKSIEQESAYRFTGTINRSLSGISIDMDVDVEVTEDARPGRIECRFHGADSGTNSSLSGAVMIGASVVGANSTAVTYEFDWQLLGRVASIGSRMVKRQLQHDISVFFSSFNDLENPNTTANSN